MLNSLIMELTYMNKNILVTGANGQLGSEIQAISSTYPSLKFFFTDRDRLDITDSLLIETFCTLHKIDTIINCAAYTAVDKAEDDNVSADTINHLATQYLAQIAQEKNKA